MTVYKLTSLFASASNADFPYIHPDKTISSNGITRTLLTPDNVSEEELYIYRIFLEALEINSEDIDQYNFGFASFDNNDVFKGNCPAYFGLKKDSETGEITMGLMLGVDAKHAEAQSHFIPCEVDKVLVKRGKKEVEEYQYTLNGNLIGLKELLDNEGKGLGKFYIQVEHNDCDVFTFPFLIDKKSEFTPKEILEHWRNGTFQNILKTFGTGSGSRLWLQSNKAFVPSFKNKSFPKEGVLFLANKGKLKITEAGSHPNITSDIVQTDWEILGTSHPDLQVQYYNKDEKGFVMTALGDATNIQFTSAKLNNEGYSFLISQGVREWDDIVLIHIVRPSSTKIEHSPVNSVSRLAARIVHKISPYPNLGAIYSEFGGQGVSQYQQLSLPATASVVTESSNITDVDFYDAQADINGDPRPIKPIFEVEESHAETLLAESIPF